VQADLNLHDVKDTLRVLADRNERLPLTMETSAVFDYVLALIEYSVPTVGIEAALMRQPKLLEAVRGLNPSLSPGAAEAAAWYLQELLRFDNRIPVEINDALDDLRMAIAARTAPLIPTDAYAAALAQRRYGAIGKLLPPF